MRKGFTQNQLKEEMKSQSVENNIPYKYTEQFFRTRYPNIAHDLYHPGIKEVIHFENQDEEDYFFKNLIEGGIFLEGLYKIANTKNINPKYITKQLERVEYREKGQKRIPKFEELDKKAWDNLIKNASKMQKKEERGLTSKLHIIIGGGIASLSGLFLLFSNITGGVISNLKTQTSNIIGMTLFVTGLITIFLLKKKKLK